MQSLWEAIQKCKAFSYVFRDVIEILSVACNCVYLSAASSCVRTDFCEQEGNDSVPEVWQNKPQLLLTWCSAEQCPTLGKYFLLHFHKYLCNSFWESCLLQKTKHAAPDINLTVCLHMRDYRHVPSLRFLHSYLRHFCLLEFFALLLQFTSCLKLWSSFLSLEFEHPWCSLKSCYFRLHK